MATSSSLSLSRSLSHFPSIFHKRKKTFQVPSSLHLLLWSWQISLPSPASPSLSLPLKSVTTHNLTLPWTSNHGARRNFWGRAIRQPPRFGSHRCSFMNSSAKSLKYRECEESRPKKFLTGEEWECPECDFFNFGRNASCLRCDCKKLVSGVRAQNPSSEGEQQQWFTKITKLEKSSDVSSSVEDGFFPRTKQSRDNSSAVATGNLSVDENVDGFNHQKTGVDMEINEFLDGVLDQRSSTDMSNIGTGPANNKHPSLVGLTRDNYSASQMGNKETDHAEKSERWFKKAAELHDVEDLSRAISDEDFPEIMPMRKGENRFVVSKKKDRSLSSPMNKRHTAMEQHAGNNKYVPFVPFPPDYFAKDKPQKGSDSRVSLPNDSDTTSTANQQSGALSSNLGMEDKATRSSPGTSMINSKGDSSDSSENQSIWRGKSLEGSAVKETDPLDMSEEAKAERWFRRVAQIKDISELSQIPDEDFPSIMPMRKGVNRFVVSKRKTPLERRLTSSQYRRNIPVVNSDPVNKGSDSN